MFFLFPFSFTHLQSLRIFHVYKRLLSDQFLTDIYNQGKFHCDLNHSLIVNFFGLCL